MGAAINQALDQALADDPTVFLLGEDIMDPAGGVMQVTTGLSTKYGRDRVRETPISDLATGCGPIGPPELADYGRERVAPSGGTP